MKSNPAIRHAQREREWQRRYANSRGYFWIPCPLCGHEFSGAEWREVGGRKSAIPHHTNPGMGKGICPSCTQAGLGTYPEDTTNAR